MDAMILAAGFGTRMLPLTRVLPKALLPVGGRTLLDLHLRYLSSQGVSCIVVNAHHMGAMVEAALADLRGRAEFAAMHFHLSLEEEILGTGGGIARAARLLTSDPVVVLNVDMLFHPDLRPILEEHERFSNLATLVCIRDPRHAKIRIQEHRVARIHDHPEPARGDLWAFSGLSVLSRRAVEEVCGRFNRDGQAVFGDLRELLVEWAGRGELGAWRETAAPFMEAGSPEAYWELCRAIGGRGEDGGGRCGWRGRDGDAAGPRSRPSDQAPGVSESVLMPDAIVGPAVRVSRCVLGPGVRADHSMDRVAAAAGEERAMPIPTRSEEEEILSALREMGLCTPPGTDPSADCRASGYGACRAAARPSIRRLKGDGSGRTLFRVVWDGHSWIVVREPDPSSVPGNIYPSRYGRAAPGPIESYLYIHACLRERRVRVPELVGAIPEGRMLVLEDLGDRHLSDVFLAGCDSRTDDMSSLLLWYERAIAQLDAIQSPLGTRLDPGRTGNLPYDPNFVRNYEIGYFLREMVQGHLGIRWPDDTEVWVTDTDRLLRDAFTGAEHVLMHRDFQSRNLMVVGDGLAVIDFQGARPGPPEYDLASLIFDPYVDLSDEMRTELTRIHLHRTAARCSRRSTDVPEAFHTRLRACGICRLMQVLGAFAYLGGRLGKQGFLEYAPAAARTLASLAGEQYPSVASLAVRVHDALLESQPKLEV